MMAKVERRKPKGQNSSRYEAAGSAPLSSTSYAVGYSMHAVMMQCLLFAIFLLLLTPNLSSAALPTIEVLPPITDHLKKPDGVAVGADEKIYIADSNNNLVHVFNRSGQYQGVISNLNAPTAVAVDAEGRIYVGNAEFGIDNVEVYASDLSLLGKLGSGNREFLTPVGIAIDSAGLIYVVDGRKNVVKVYKADRSFEFSFGSPGAADGEFQAPSSIVINEARSEILIPDLSLAGNSARVQVFDLNGVFLRSFRTEDANGVGFSNPTGIAVDTLDRIYVTDSSQANVVMVYDALGTPIDTLYDSNVSLPSPQDVAFAPGTSRLFIASLNPANVHEGAVETFGIDSSYGSIAVSPESHDFGSTAVSAASASQSFNISNTGNGKLYVEGAGGITLTGANASEFSIVSNDCADTILVPAAGCTIGVQFEPVSAGSKSASLAIVSDDLYMPTLSVALSGNAVAQQYKLTVSKGGDGNGTVLAAGINCGTTCSADYVAGTVVTLSVTHGGDAVFAGWSGGGCNGTADCEVTMGASHNVTAIFNNNPVPVPTHSITASASANGSISPAGTVSVDEGSTATFDITAADGYRVSDVLVDSVSVGAVGSYSFKDVDAAHTISAEFTAVSTLLLSSIEIGEVSVGDEWKPVTLSNTFTDPIVVLKPASLNDTSSAVIQMRSVSAQSFEVRIREWDYVVAMEGDGGQHEEEQVSYVVMERGSYTLDDGTRVEAGRFDTDVLSASFTQTFVTAPVVISSIVTNNDAEDTPAIIQMSNVGITGFDYKLQEEELNDQVHAVETVSFIAWEASEGIQNGIKFEVGKVTDALPEQTALVEFSGSYASSPRFIADIQTTNGGVANLRWENKTATDVDLLIDQEESLQNPTSTSKEDIGYLLLSTFDGDCDGLPDEDEVNAYGTNPQLADTDGDGLPDGEEVSFWGGEWDDDNDGDGKINLLDIDSDGNGFRDGSNEPVGDGTPTNTEVSCASLAVRSHTLTVETDGSGGGKVQTLDIVCSANCSKDYSEGTLVQLSAVAAEGSVFAGWSGGCSGEGRCDVPMTQPTKVIATFNTIYALTVKMDGSGSGQVQVPGIDCSTDCSEDYSDGTLVTLSAVAAEGSVFAGWSGGECDGMVGDCEITMDQARAVTATFNSIPVPVVTYAITATAGANGNISPAGTVSVDEGSTKTFVITADSKYRVSDVLVDSVSVGAVGSYSFKDVDADGHTISAEFAAVSTLLLSSIEMGEVSVGDDWEPVTLSNTFADPIIVLKPASSNDTASAVIQMRPVNAQKFDVRIREWDYVVALEGDGGQHKEEQVSYVVMERGSYILEDGTRVEAGQFDTDVLSGSFTQTFTTAPVVTSSIVTNNDAEDTPAIIQMSNVSVAGFDYKLQEEELNDQVHAVETVSFIAWEVSEGMHNGIKFEVGKVTDALPEQTTVVEFSGSYASPPRFIADLQTANEGVANLRWKDKSATGISLRIDQEQSLQNSISTSQENIGYILLSSFDSDCDGLSDADEDDIYDTDPQLADTDGDGMLDGKEVSFWGAAWDDDFDGDGLKSLRDMDSAGIGLRDNSTVPVGDGTFTKVDVSCANLVVSNGQDATGETGTNSDQMDTDTEDTSGSSSTAKSFNHEAVKFERSSVEFKREGTKFERKGTGFKPNGVEFKRKGIKFNQN